MGRFAFGVGKTLRKVVDYYFVSLDKIHFSEYEYNARLVSIKLTCFVVLVATCFVFISIGSREDVISWRLLFYNTSFPYTCLLFLSIATFWFVHLTNRYSMACWVMGGSLVAVAWYIVVVGGSLYARPITVLFLPPILVFGLG